MIVMVDALPAFPGKSGAVGAFRNILTHAPTLDHDVEWRFIVAPSQYRYYRKKYGKDLPENVVFKVLNFPESSRLLRLAIQNFLVPIICQNCGADIHFSMNPEPVCSMKRVREVFKIVDLQFFDVPDQFGIYKTTYRKFMSRRKIERSTLVIANSEYTKTQILERFKLNSRKIRVIYEAVDHQLFSCDGDKEKHRNSIKKSYGITKPFILYVSSFRPYKNHLPLLDAYRCLIQDSKIEHNLVLVGIDIGNYKQTVENAVMERGLADRIHCLDYVMDADLGSFYKAASLSVYPSALETFGIPPLESMACGTPVIVSSLTSIPEISGGGADIVNPYSAEKFCDAMKRVLIDKEYYDALASRGLSWCRQFTWKRNMQQTISAFRSILHK